MKFANQIIRPVNFFILSFIVAWSTLSFCGEQPAEVTKPLLGLVMIVKDEAKSMQKLADSIKDYIDYWTILDTGSTDGTQEIIKEAFQGVPGQLFEEPFIDFATSRNRALELADSKSVFMLSLDGDMVVEHMESLRSFCMAHKDDMETGYKVQILDESNGLTWPNAWLMRAQKGVKWVGRVHEYVVANISPDQVPKTLIVHCKDRQFQKSQARHERDVKLLLEDYLENPNDSRALFYLAQTYDCLGDMERAFKHYAKRAQMGGFPSEVYESLYRCGRLAKQLGKSNEQVVQLFTAAFEHSPHRAEPLCEIASIYNEESRFALAYIYALRAASLPFPKNEPLFVQAHKYNFDRWNLLAILGWYVGEFEVGYQAAAKLAAVYPEHEQAQKNLQFYLDHQNEQ